MQAIRIIQEASPDGYLHIKVPEQMGKMIEVVLKPLNDKVIPEDSFTMMKIQEQSTFIQMLLLSKEEDIWNDV